jgi:hypothetical protein
MKFYVIITQDGHSRVDNDPPELVAYSILREHFPKSGYGNRIHVAGDVRKVILYRLKRTFVNTIYSNNVLASISCTLNW